MCNWAIPEGAVTAVIWLLKKKKKAQQDSEMELESSGTERTNGFWIQSYQGVLTIIQTERSIAATHRIFILFTMGGADIPPVPNADQAWCFSLLEGYYHRQKENSSR